MRTVERHSLARDTTGSRIAAMGTVGVKEVVHIAVPAVVERDIDMNVPEQCAVRQTEAKHNVEGFDGSMGTAGCDYCASTQVPADGVDLGFG